MVCILYFGMAAFFAATGPAVCKILLTQNVPLDESFSGICRSTVAAGASGFSVRRSVSSSYGQAFDSGLSSGSSLPRDFMGDSRIRPAKGEDLLRLQQGYGAFLADYVDAQDPIRIAKVDLLLDVGGEVFNDLDGVILLPAAFVYLHAPGLVIPDPVFDVAVNHLFHRIKAGFAPVVDRHPLDRKLKGILRFAFPQRPATFDDLAIVQTGMCNRDAHYVGLLDPGGEVAESLQDADGLGLCPIEMAPGVGDKKIHAVVFAPCVSVQGLVSAASVINYAGDGQESLMLRFVTIPPLLSVCSSKYTNNRTGPPQWCHVERHTSAWWQAP